VFVWIVLGGVGICGGRGVPWGWADGSVKWDSDCYFSVLAVLYRSCHCGLKAKPLRLYYIVTAFASASRVLLASDCASYFSLVNLYQPLC
jgi:hypothetical protein